MFHFFAFFLIEAYIILLTKWSSIYTFMKDNMLGNDKDDPDSTNKYRSMNSASCLCALKFNGDF